jgi:hypothetical protein
MSRIELEKIENYRIDLDTVRKRYYVYRLSDDDRYYLETKKRRFEDAMLHIRDKLKMKKR